MNNSKINKITFEENEELIKECIHAGGKIRIYPKGSSMLPTIRESIDSVIIMKCSKIKVNDIVLYYRENGQLVLHRVYSCTGDKLCICGDNQMAIEHGVKPENIIGIVTGIYRKNTYISSDNPCYNMYVKIWRFFMVRKIVFKIRNLQTWWNLKK